MATKKIDLQQLSSKIQAVQSQIRSFVKESAWIKDAKRLVSAQRGELKTRLNREISQARTRLEQGKKGLEALQRELPKQLKQEEKKLRKFVDEQKKELEKLLKTVRTQAKKKANGRMKKKGTKAARHSSSS